MNGFKSLGVVTVLCALFSTPACLWAQVSEPSAAAAQDPTFSIYSNDGSSFSRTMASEAPVDGSSGLHLSVRPHRRYHASGEKRY